MADGQFDGGDSQSTAGEDDGNIDDLLDRLTAENGSGPIGAFRSTDARTRGIWLGALIGLAAAAVVGSVILSWVALSRSSSTTTVEANSGSVVDERTRQIEAVIGGLGYDGVEVVQVGDTVVLSGTVPTEVDRTKAVGAVEALLDGRRLDATALVVDAEDPLAAPEGDSASTGSAVAGTAASGTSDDATPDAGGDDRGTALQVELNRITAATPLIFDVGEGQLSPLHERVLNNVATVLVAYPNHSVIVVGFTDSVGDPEDNRRLSLARAGAVRSYLLGQGVADGQLEVAAKGEETSTGSTDLAGLERRVEFEVGGATAGPVAPSDDVLRIALVAPSASNDLAFTQSMVDAIDVIARSRGNVEVDVTDNTFVPEEAAAAISAYAADDYDLIIAHGVEFGSALLEIVEANPDVTFAWGTATDTFGLPNLYAYDAAAEEGGYVMGAMASLLTDSGTVGVVGPIEVADASRYVDGFQAGAAAVAPRPMVLVEYTGSFGDIALAAEVAEEHVAAGADVMTGTAEMVVGAIAVASENDVLWFGTQASQASLDPDIVVASQVYHWEVALAPIVTDIDNDVRDGRAFVADLANGGLVIEYNPGYSLAPDVRQRADDLTTRIIAGTVAVPRP